MARKKRPSNYNDGSIFSLVWSNAICHKSLSNLGLKQASEKDNYWPLWPDEDDPTYKRRTISTHWGLCREDETIDKKVDPNNARLTALECMRAAEGTAVVVGTVLEGKKLVDLAENITAVPSLSSDDISAYGFVNRTTGRRVQSNARLRRELQAALRAAAEDDDEDDDDEDDDDIPPADDTDDDEDDDAAAAAGVPGGDGGGGGDANFATPPARPVGRLGINIGSGSSGGTNGSSGSGRRRFQEGLGRRIARAASARRGRSGRGTPPSAASSSGYSGEDEGYSRRGGARRNVRSELDEEEKKEEEEEEEDDDEEEDEEPAVLLDEDDDGEVGNRVRASPPGSAHRSIATGTVRPVRSSGRRRRDPPGSSMMEPEGIPLGTGMGNGGDAPLLDNEVAEGRRGVETNGLGEGRSGGGRRGGRRGISNNANQDGRTSARGIAALAGDGGAGTGDGPGALAGDQPRTLDEAKGVIKDLREKLSAATGMNRNLARLAKTAQANYEGATQIIEERDRTIEEKNQEIEELETIDEMYEGGNEGKKFWDWSVVTGVVVPFILIVLLLASEDGNLPVLRASHKFPRATESPIISLPSRRNEYPALPIPWATEFEDGANIESL